MPKTSEKTSQKAAAKPSAKPLAVKAASKGDHVFLVDGSSYIFRAYHALPPLSRKSDGLQVNAVLGFCNMLWKLMRDMKPEDKPTHLAVIFDKSEKTFRNELYKDYKAHRPDAPADLIPQFPLIRDATRAFDIPCLEMLGFEADDLIATYARQACAVGANVTIVSSDKDLMQLVNDCVIMYDTMKDKKIGIAEVIEKFGVPPESVIDVQALMGDSIDNVPGVKGVGPKAASTLIFELGSLDRIFEAEVNPATIEAELQAKLDLLQSEIDKLAGESVKIGSGSHVAKILSEKFNVADLPKDKKNNLTADAAKIEELAGLGNAFCRSILRARNLSRVIGGTVTKIIASKNEALISKTLVTLRDDVKLDVPLDDLAVHEPDHRLLIAFLKAMEFSTLTRRVAEFAAVDASAVDADATLVSSAKSSSSPLP